MPNSEALVCICIPVYNSEKTIAETLESILSQTYQNILIQVFDNASTDNTLGVLSKYDDPRLVVYQGKTNIGGEGNFNRCIDNAKGLYTAIFHADDVYEKDIVAKQVAMLDKNPNVGAVFVEATKIDINGKVIGSIRRPSTLPSSKSVYSFNELFPSLLLYSNFLVCPSAMLRTEIYQNTIGRFRVDMFGSSADLDVWLRVSLQHLVAVIPEKLIRYRLSKTQGTYIINRVRTERSDLFRVLDYYVDLAQAQKILTESDIRHYGWLQRSDRVVRAMNFWLNGESEKAEKLCSDLLSFDALRAAFRYKRGWQTWLLGIYIRFVIKTGMDAIGRAVLLRVKQVMHW